MKESTYKTIIGILVIFLLLSLIGIQQLISAQAGLAKRLEDLKTADRVQVNINEKIEGKTENNSEVTAYPIVIFEREGLLGVDEKSRIEKQLVAPFTLYYNEVSDEAIALIITVPEEEGESFEVRAVFKNGDMISFLYGMRGDVLEYWTPSCEGEPGCVFSEAFRKVYPQIVDNAEAP